MTTRLGWDFSAQDLLLGAPIVQIVRSDELVDVQATRTVIARCREANVSHQELSYVAVTEKQTHFTRILFTLCHMSVCSKSFCPWGAAKSCQSFFFSIDVVVKLKAHFCPYYNVVRSMWSGVNCGIKSPLMPLHCPCTAIRLVVRYFTFQRNQLLRCYFCFSLTYRHHKLVRKTRLWVCSQLRAGGTHALVVLLGHRRETSVH